MATGRTPTTLLRSVILFFGVAGLLVLTEVSLLWACVPQPRLITVQPRSSGPPGTEVTVAALGFDPGRAEVRWNSSDGELLASTTGPEFSVKITVPQAEEGLYHLIVLARSPGGEIGNTGAVSFQITPPGAPPADVTSLPVRSQEAEEDEGSTNSISIGAVAVSAGVGAVAALCCLGGILLLRGRQPAG